MTRRLLATLGAVVAGALMIGRAQAPGRETIKRHFTPADQVTGRYQYVPFDVRPGTGRLRASYHYDRANGDNVIDLGLFEPGPLDLGTTTFRGYSGGARSEIILTHAEATPGYRVGTLPNGRWHVLLGLYRVATSGVDVTVTIETAARDVINIADYAPSQSHPRPSRSGWYIGALHTHTLHSDGTVSPPELLRLFGDKRFDFVVITDHNNTTHTQEPSDLPDGAFGPLRIIGEEVTTPGGHASVWGLPRGGWVDFRVLPGDPRIRDLVVSARKQGAMFSINHPASECLACGWTHEIVDGIEGIEISNGRHGEVEKAIAMWDELLVSGRRITGVGSSDWHSAPNPIDNANVRVRAPALTQEAVLAAIRGGRVIVMTNAQDATPEVVVRAGERSAGIGESLPIAATGTLGVAVNTPAAAGGQLVVVLNGRRKDAVTFDAEGVARAEMPAARGYIRFEIVKSDGSPLAYTNPVYLVQQ